MLILFIISNSNPLFCSLIHPGYQNLWYCGTEGFFFLNSFYLLLDPLYLQHYMRYVFNLLIFKPFDLSAFLKCPVLPFTFDAWLISPTGLQAVYTTEFHLEYMLLFFLSIFMTKNRGSKRTFGLIPLQLGIDHPACRSNVIIPSYMFFMILIYKFPFSSSSPN